jgi:NAD+ synthetase
MQVESFLELSAAKSPNHTALVCNGARYTYREIDGKANRLAWSLVAGGVERGDRVAIYLENSMEAVVSVFAALKAGAVFLVINPTTKPDKVSFILNNCRAKALITDGVRLGPLTDALAEAPHLRGAWACGGSALPGLPNQSLFDLTAALDDAGLPVQAPPKKCIDIDLAALIYTSGSTGRPKGVMLTHLNIVSAATSITTYLENRSDDIILSVLPLSFDYGLYQVLMAFKIGGTVILERSFTYPFKVIELLLQERVTGFPIVPTISAVLLQLDLSAYRFPSLRYITNTAAALPTDHIRRLRDLFPDVRIFSMYGLTECKRVSYLPPDQIDVRPTSVGRGMPNEEVYVVDETGRRVPAGVVGELVVRGSNVMKGYWELPEETDRMLKAGPLPGEKVLHTGDLFRTDEEGFLYFVGRKDDIIKTRGEKVSPREVEDVLHAMPGVAEAAVIGVPDEVLGEAVKAIVRPQSGGRTHREGCHQLVLAEARELHGAQVRRFSGRVSEDVHGKGQQAGVGPGQRRLCGESSIEINMTTTLGFSADVLTLDAAATAAAIEGSIRDIVLRQLNRRGVVVAISGGIDSSVVAALCVNALGPERVLGLMLPESDSSPESLRLGEVLTESLGIQTHVEDIAGILTAAGCYQRRDSAIRKVIPEYGDGYKCKIVLPDQVSGNAYAIFSVVVQSPDGQRTQARLTLDAYLGVVAATNFKQRTRKMMEYYYADRTNYAVAGTPNRLEYDQGFFVKNGDGAADLKPIAHLYKSQVYRLAAHLAIPEEIQKRPPTTDTYPLDQSQEEFYFPLPYDKMDLCLYGKNHGVSPEEVAPVVGLTAEQVVRVYRVIDSTRNATRYLHRAPVLCTDIPEVRAGQEDRDHARK